MAISHISLINGLIFLNLTLTPTVIFPEFSPQTLDRFSAAPLGQIAQQPTAIPSDWKQHLQTGMSLWLPPSYEGGDVQKDLNLITQ